jgi:hypothetical protein
MLLFLACLFAGTHCVISPGVILLYQQVRACVCACVRLYKIFVAYFCRAGKVKYTPEQQAGARIIFNVCWYLLGWRFLLLRTLVCATFCSFIT